MNNLAKALEIGKKALLAFKSLIMNTLDFLSLLDYKGRLSITNLHIWIMTVLFGYTVVQGTSSDASWTVIGGLLAAFANYSHKRYTSSKSSEIESKKKLDEANALNKKFADRLKNAEHQINQIKVDKNLKSRSLGGPSMWYDNE